MEPLGEVGVVYVQLHNDPSGYRTSLFDAGQDTDDEAVTSALIQLAATMLHELVHICDPAADEHHDPLCSITEAVAKQYKELALTRYGLA